MLKLIIFFVFVTTALNAPDYNSNNNFNYNPFPWWDTDDNKEFPDRSTPKTTPFPQCLSSGSRSKYLQSSNLQKLFDQAIRDTEQDSKYEYQQNYKKNNRDMVDDDNDDDEDSQSTQGRSRAVASAAIKVTREIMSKLACDLNGTDTDSLQNFLGKLNIPGGVCKSDDNVDCNGKVKFRMVDGLCNNLQKPYLGNSHTAFGRIKPAVYQDYVSEPRRLSRRGGPLPGCRKVSLALGSKPIFDRRYNGFFTGFGQYIGHDIALSIPVSDTYYTPITTCTCESKYDWNKCTVIDIPSDDPYLRGQKCMAFPATAQALKNDVCSLGVKEQLNGNTHFIDLSGLYGSRRRIAEAVRGDNGLLKSSRPYGLKHEMPPAQREGKSCFDHKPKQRCFAGGDSRLMITLIFTGIQTMFLRAHNILARGLHELHPKWSSDEIYESAKLLNTAYFQKIIYENWLPILLGKDVSNDAFPILKPTETTTYDPDVQPLVYNEVATAAFRLHSLCRDLFSRCTSSGKRIDQLWMNDISHQAKYAYDFENNGLDSLLCGALYDYGFAYDKNFAYQMHHDLFPTTSKYGQTWRNDLISINICRGREHGVPSYNTYLKYCNFTKAEYFEDFGRTINYEGIKILKKLYADVDDVDLFVALNLEDPVSGGLVGPVTSCLIVKQFIDLRDGDRFFYTHKKALTLAQRRFINDVPLYCFVCLTVDIDEVPENPFVTPVDENQLKKCSECKHFNIDNLKNLFPDSGDDADAADAVDADAETEEGS